MGFVPLAKLYILSSVLYPSALTSIASRPHSPMMYRITARLARSRYRLPANRLENCCGGGGGLPAPPAAHPRKRLDIFNKRGIGSLPTVSRIVAAGTGLRPSAERPIEETVLIFRSSVFAPIVPPPCRTT